MGEDTQWSLNPEEWPHTPPLEVYMELQKQDSNIFWRMPTGHLENLLDEALERIEEVEVRPRERDEADSE